MDPLQLLITNDLLRVLDLLGVFVMGVAAGALASRLNFDAVGFAIIGITAGLGGGIVRDLILDYGTPAAFDGPWYLTCALGGAAFAFFIPTDGSWWRRLVTALDIVALGLWAATGTAKSLGYGLDVLPAILLGITSAVGGGVIRDVLVGRIPAIFGGGPLYATGALVTAVLTWLVFELGLPSGTVLIAVAVGAGLAGVAAWRRWTLPGHSEWQVTMSSTQLKRLVRRTRNDERERVALETGTIPVVSESTDDLADDMSAPDSDAAGYAERTFHEAEQPVNGQSDAPWSTWDEDSPQADTLDSGTLDSDTLNSSTLDSHTPDADTPAAELPGTVEHEERAREGGDRNQPEPGSEPGPGHRPRR